MQSLQSQSQIQIKPERKSITQSKKNYQFIWRAVFVFITIASAVLINKIYQYQTSQFLADIKKGSIFQLIVYGIPFGTLFILCENLIHKLLDQKCQLHYLNLEKYKTQQSRKRRAYTIVKWAFSIIYYLISSVTAFLIIKQTSFMPTWLGGEGYCTDLSRYVNSFDQANFSMQVYYVLQFGKHLGRFIQHCFVRPQGNYYQYALHHGLSTFLIFFSYLTNQWIIGIFVLLIHDVSDIALIMCRAYRDCKKIFKPFLTFMDITGGTLWVFCRIFLLSYCCVFSSAYTSLKFTTNPEQFNPLIMDIIRFPGYFMAFMLFALQIMQIFWTYYIFSSIIAVNVSDKIAKHTYD